MGFVHIYYGNGKGKTTAAVGLMVRAAGFGMRVLCFQFMKNNSSSERKILEALPGVTCLKGPEKVKFSFRMTGEEKAEALADNEERLRMIERLVQEETYGMLVLDEAVYAVQAGLLKEESLIGFLKRRPHGLEVVLTGNGPDERLLACADYATEMRMEKHPFTKGIPARDGIER